MAYDVKYHQKVIKFLEKCEKGFAKKVLDSFDGLAATNASQIHLDIRPLKGSPKNHFRLRLGKYRFLYEIRQSELLIFCYDADSRGGIYK